MNCPHCNAVNNTKVVDVKAALNGLLRKRECLSCATRFTTHERFVGYGYKANKKDKNND